MMHITLNGNRHACQSATLTLQDLLTELGLAGKPVVIEHNQNAILPREIATTTVSEGDVIEIVQITAGG